MPRALRVGSPMCACYAGVGLISTRAYIRRRQLVALELQDALFWGCVAALAVIFGTLLILEFLRCGKCARKMPRQKHLGDVRHHSSNIDSDLQMISMRVCKLSGERPNAEVGALIKSIARLHTDASTLSWGVVKQHGYEARGSCRTDDCRTSP